jgi:hypothetical protein
MFTTSGIPDNLLLPQAIFQKQVCILVVANLHLGHILAGLGTMVNTLGQYLHQSVGKAIKCFEDCHEN